MIDISPSFNSSEIILYSTILLFIALVLFSVSRGYEITEANLFMINFRFKRIISFNGIRILHLPSIILIALSLVGLIIGYYKKEFIEKWPTYYRDLHYAKLVTNDIDDFIFININGIRAVEGVYGQGDETDVIKYFREGLNNIEIIIQNGQYGGCSGHVQLILNKSQNPYFDWRFIEQKGQMPNVVCYQHSYTLILK